MRVHVINVGQGAATLFEFACGAVLIDTGSEQNNTFDGNAALLSYLDAFFARRTDLDGQLDLLLITHPHIDHNRGVCEVISRYGPKHLVDSGLPGTGVAEPGQQCLHDDAARGTPYEAVALVDIDDPAGITSDVIDPITCDGTDPQIRVLFGKVPRGADLLPHWDGPSASNPNNNSVVARIDFGRFSMLVTGDLQEAGIDELLRRADPAALDVDVYQAGHHGSHNATTEGLADAMTPEVAVISMGDSAGSQDKNSAWAYGHPSNEALSILLGSEHGVSRSRPPVVKPVGVSGRNPTNGDPPVWDRWTIRRAVYGTGWDGTILITARADGSFSVDTE